jgi:hypothetical protein
MRSCVAVLMLSAQLLAACTLPFDPHSGIGVESESGSEHVGISYLRCTGEKVTSVEVATDPTNGAGETIWRITPGPTAEDSTHFFLGETPPGWLTSVPLQALPSKSEHYRFHRNDEAITWRNLSFAPRPEARHDSLG